MLCPGPVPDDAAWFAGSLTEGGVYLNGDLRCIGISTDGLTAAQAATWESALTAVPTGIPSGLATPVLYDETTADDANGVMTTVDGTKLARWRDGNGIGPLLVQLSSTTAPSFKWWTPSYGGVRFSGAHALLCPVASNPPSIFTGSTWFVVLNVETAGLGLVLSRTNGLQKGWHLYTATSGYVVQVNTQNFQGATPSPGTRFILCMRYNDTTSTFSTWCNNANKQEQVVLTSNVTESPFALVVGTCYSNDGSSANTGAYAWTGTLHTIQVYPVALHCDRSDGNDGSQRSSDANVTACYTFLRQKYHC